LQGETDDYVEVADTGHNTIQGYYLKWLTITYHSNMPPITDTIYERIGCTGINFPYMTSVLSTDPFISGFCNYSDNTFSNWPNSDEYCTDLPTGISPLESEEFISVFPNPNRGDFTFVCSDPGKDGGELTITDMWGREFFSRLVDSREGNSTTVSLGVIQPGIYYLSFHSKGIAYLRKIVVE
jgi:hypothetical protein